MDITLNWMAHFRLSVLIKHPGENLEQCSDKWGRFPPHLQHSVDQVPLPFVVSMDSTYTMADDTDVHVSGGGTSADLRKRQFTMHIHMNAGEGDKADGHTELMCRGKVLEGSRFSLAERSQWNEKAKMWFQKSAWMDRVVMGHSANRFSNHIKERWGNKAKALLTCDNLDAHICDSTKEITSKDGRVFLFCFPPAVTEAVQPTDAGHGRSIRSAIGRELDKWLEKDENLEIWERGMTAGERRVLISDFVAAANDETLHRDELRVGCFK